jgi:integrase
LLVAFHEYAEERYRRSDGRPSAAVAEYRAAGRPLHQLYGHVPAANVGPLALKAVRQKLVEEGTCCRKTINARIGKLKRVFKWGVENELIPVAVHTALSTVAGLEAGRTGVRDNEPVAPVDDELVEAALPFLSRHVRGLVQFQRLTGARPGEAMAVRRCDIDTSGSVWLYRPGSHKGKHRGKTRTIAIGARGQELLRQFFTDDGTDYLFSPRRAVEERNAKRRAGRRTPMTPSQAKRRPKANPKRPPAEKYTRQSYLTAVVRACDQAFPLPVELAPRKKGGRAETRKEWWERLTAPERARVEEWWAEHRWFPYQIRHTFATSVRKEHGLEAAQVLLGHERADVTQTYALRNEALAAKIAAEVG